MEEGPAPFSLISRDGVRLTRCQMDGTLNEADCCQRGVTDLNKSYDRVFLRFQMIKVTKDHCLEVINKFEPCSENQKQGVLGIDGMSTSVVLQIQFLQIIKTFFSEVAHG